MRPRIEALVEGYGLQDRVRLAGWRRDIDRAMKSFDALLLTSHWEGLPRVILEAASTGLPIVATRVGGVEEAVVQVDNARLYEAGDIAGLAAGLETMLREREAGGETIGIRKGLPKEFHIEEMVKQYQYLYDRLLSQQAKLMPSPAAQP